MSQPTRPSSCEHPPSSDIPSDTPSVHPRKKQKLVYPTKPPPAEIPLTRNALREPIQPAAQYIYQSTPMRLGLIKRFARTGGPDLSDLRGYYYEPSIMTDPNMSSSQSGLGSRKSGLTSPSKSGNILFNATTNRTGPHDRAFEQNLIDYGVYPDDYEYPDTRVPPPADNIEDITRALAQRRPSLSPSPFKKRQVEIAVIPIIEGYIEDGKCVSGAIPFTNLDDLTDGTLVPGNPDLYYGARPEQLDRQIRTKLSGHIVPSTQHLPIAPNFFLATKGRYGAPTVAMRQACYDSALGARGIRSLQAYADGGSEPNNKAYTITSTYQDGTLKTYTSHLTPTSPGARPEYVMTRICAYALTNNHDTFRTGAGAYRNARDWAKLQRNEAIRKANERAIIDKRSTSASPGKVALSLASIQVSESDTAAHELEVETPPAKRLLRR
ncbi:hypothetical protein F5X99DRAFT_420314 [Biscogniauxia marginata]|nr:hypothetical protein F5X99DRAFT_420314 [Biscogniauxia marginata]